MAKITNTRTHDITLTALVGDAIQSYTIPGASENPLARTELINGVNENVPDEFIAAAVKSNDKVVGAFLSDGWLVIDGGKAPKAK